MIYSLLATFVLAIHGAFIVFVVLGGVLALWKPRLAWFHLPALAWGVAIIAMGWICPLTPLENTLRVLAGQQGYSGGFIEHYLLSVIYPDGLTRQIQILMAALLIIGNGAVYTILYRRWAHISRNIE